MAGWIKFKGITSTVMGCKIESMPAEATPKRRLEPVEVPGHSGTLHTADDSYDSITLTAVLNLVGRADVRAVTAWLDGWGDLVLSDSAQYRRKAVVVNGMSSKRRRLHNGEAYDSLTVKFECDPFLYEVDPEYHNVLAPHPPDNPYRVDNPSGITALPIIVIHGTGQIRITVGDTSVTLTNMAGAVTIDCDAKEAYKGTPDQQTAITLDDHDWPELGPGITKISWTGDVQRVQITPNWRWL